MPNKHGSGWGSKPAPKKKPAPVRGEQKSADWIPKTPPAKPKNRGRSGRMPVSPVQRAGVDGGLGAVTGFLGDRVREAQNIGVGTVKGSVETAGAIGNLARGHKPRKQLKILRDMGLGFAASVDEIVPQEIILSGGVAPFLLKEALGYKTPQLDRSVLSQDPKTGKWIVGAPGDTARAGKAWKERPLTSTLVAASVLAPGFKLAEVNRISKTLRKANPELSLKTARKLARKEAGNPGYLKSKAALGHETISKLKGLDEAQVQPRLLRTPYGEAVSATQSRSPLGRQVQAGADAISRRIPEQKPFSESRRAQEFKRRSFEHMEKATVTDLIGNRMAPVRKVGYSRFGRSSKPEQAMMTYALQLPKDVSPLEAAKMVHRDLGEQLAKTGLTEFERKSLESQVKGLEKVIENPPNPEAMAAAVDGLAEMAKGNENLGLYVATRGAQGVDPALYEAIVQGFRNRKNLVSDRVRLKELESAGRPEDAAAISALRRRNGSAASFPSLSGEMAASYVDRVRGASTREWNLSAPDPGDLASGNVVLRSSGDAGYALTPSTGYVGFVHNIGPTRGAGTDALLDGVLNGATWLDAYDGFLPGRYEQLGFREVGRVHFDPTQAPPGVKGTPDVVFMAYAPHLPAGVKAPYMEYDAAAARAAVLGREGAALTPPKQFVETLLGEDARAYFPHERVDTPQSGTLPTATRRPAAGSVIGVPKKPSLKGPNKLSLYERGLVNVDPRVLVGQYTRRLKFYFSEIQRRELYHDALPVSDVPEGVVGDGYFIRNPDMPPAKLTAQAKNLMSEHGAQDVIAQALDWDSRIDQSFFQALKEWSDEAFADGRNGIPQEWVTDFENGNVRWIPKYVAEKRMREVFSAKPAQVPVLPIANSLARLATIQGKPLRYVSSNAIQNMVMMLITNPIKAAAALRNQVAMVPVIDRAFQKLNIDRALRNRDPELYNLVRVETGDVAAQAGLPDFYTRPQNKGQKFEQGLAGVQEQLGTVLGEWGDNPYRVATYIHYAEKAGIKTDAELRAFLKSEDPAVVRVRDRIRQQTRDDMLDFDRLTPWEQNVARQWLFIWPFVRASLRYPATFARDYPGRTGVAVGASVGQGQNALGDVPVASRDLYRFQNGPKSEYDAGWLVPFGAATDTLSNANRLATNLGQVANGGQFDFSAVSDMLTPGAQYGVGAVAGNGPSLDTAARSLVPGYGAVRDIADKGVKGIPVVARFSSKKGDDRLSRKTRADKHKDAAKLQERWAKASQDGDSLPDPAEVVRSWQSWWLFNEFRKRATYGAKEQGRTKLTANEEALVLHRVLKETHPEAVDKLADEQQVVGASPAAAEAYVKALRKFLFGARDQVLDAGR